MAGFWNLIVYWFGGIHDMRWFGVAIHDHGAWIYRITYEMGQDGTPWMFRVNVFGR